MFIVWLPRVLFNRTKRTPLHGDCARAPGHSSSRSSNSNGVGDGIPERAQVRVVPRALHKLRLGTKAFAATARRARITRTTRSALAAFLSIFPPSCSPFKTFNPLFSVALAAMARLWHAFESFGGLSSGAKVGLAAGAVCALAAAQVLLRKPKREGHDLFSSEKPEAVRGEKRRSVEEERALAARAAAGR
jgi:hypothetical protein